MNRPSSTANQLRQRSATLHATANPQREVKPYIHLKNRIQHARVVNCFEGLAVLSRFATSPTPLFLLPLLQVHSVVLC